MARSSLTAQLASQILDHIRTNRLPRGQHLPSQLLADAFRVSRAPITSAFKLLESMGVVRFEANRGYFLARDAQDCAPSSCWSTKTATRMTRTSKWPKIDCPASCRPK